MAITLGETFGVKKEEVRSYLSRKNVDERFVEELRGDKHIIVYGSSKQGKSALIQKHIAKSNSITIGCSTRMTTKDIYSSLLRQLDVRVESSVERTKGTSGELLVKTTFKAKLPFFGDAGAEVAGKTSGNTTDKQQSNYIEYNLDIAQDVNELLKKINFDKIIIIENFHYLEEDVQKLFSVDLRLFQENDIRFVILGIWREKNRLTQFNRDLIDRIIEIPVEPWSIDDFEEVIEKGSKILNVQISDSIKSQIKEIAFGNIGIVQELCRELLVEAGVFNAQESETLIESQGYLEKAIETKVAEYASSHLRSLESIAETGQQTNGLYLPYYLIRFLIESNIEQLKDGIPKSVLHEKIRSIHHKKDHVRVSDMTNLLHGLAEKQSKKMISPPLFDYDRVNRQLRIIDSTLMFFLNFKNRDEVLEEIINPVERDQEAN